MRIVSFANMITKRVLCNFFGGGATVHMYKVCRPFVFVFSSLTCTSDMEFLEVLTEGLERVLLVRGGGREVITIYS